MATNQSARKNRLIEAVILVFVIVSVSLLALQLGMNVADMLEQSQASDAQPPDNMLTLTPAGPTPTIDFSLPVSEMR